MSSRHKTTLLTLSGVHYFTSIADPNQSPPKRDALLPVSSPVQPPTPPPRSPPKIACPLSVASTSKLPSEPLPVMNWSRPGTYTVPQPPFEPPDSLLAEGDALDAIMDISDSQWDADVAILRSSRSSGPSSATEVEELERDARRFEDEHDYWARKAEERASPRKSQLASLRAKRKRTLAVLAEDDEVQPARSSSSRPILAMQARSSASPSPRSTTPPITPHDPAPSECPYEWSPSPPPRRSDAPATPRLAGLFSPVKSNRKGKGKAKAIVLSSDEEDDSKEPPSMREAASAASKKSSKKAKSEASPYFAPESDIENIPAKPQRDPKADDIPSDLDEMMDLDADEYDLPLDDDLAHFDPDAIPSKANTKSASTSSTAEDTSDFLGRLFGDTNGVARTTTTTTGRGALREIEGNIPRPHPRSGPASEAGFELGFTPVSELDEETQDFYLNHFRRGVDGDQSGGRVGAKTPISAPQKRGRGAARTRGGRAVGGSSGRSLVRLGSEDEDEGDYEEDEDGGSSRRQSPRKGVGGAKKRGVAWGRGRFRGGFRARGRARMR